MSEEQKMENIGDPNTDTLSSSVETKVAESEVQAVQPEKTEKSTEVTEDNASKQVSGAEKRIHKLVDERDSYREKVQTLESRLAELTAEAQANAGNSQTYQPAQGESSGGERELTVDDLRTIARLEAQKLQTYQNIKTESIEATKMFPELDKTSEDFDPEISNAVSDAVENEIRLNPTQSVKKLTEKYMRVYRKAAEKAVTQEKKVIAKQVNDEALRPSTIKGNDKKFHEKSLEEMEAELGFTY